MKYKSLRFFYYYFLLRRLYEKRTENIFRVKIEWWEGITEKQVGYFVRPIELTNGKTGAFLLIDIDSCYGKVCKGLTMTLLSIKDCKPVIDCSFKEFVEYYGELYVQYIKGKVMI